MVKVKQPVRGIVEYVSKNGTEVHLKGDKRRYRGVKLTLLKGYEQPINRKCKTAPIFRWYGVKVGDLVTLHWGGFANLNIKSLDIHRAPALRVQAGLPPFNDETKAQFFPHAKQRKLIPLGS